MKISVGQSLAIAAIVALSGCSSEPSSSPEPSFPEAPLGSFISDTQGLHIDVRTSPDQPPRRGVIDVELRFSDGLDTFNKQLHVAVEPWMPAMNHGTGTTPTITDEGGSRFIASDINLFMPGLWELRTTITGDVNDRATIDLEIP